MWFFRGGEEPRETPKEHGAASGTGQRRIYDYAVDGKYIYAAFLDQYGIDLIDVKYLHWWKFRAMFVSLRGDHEIMRIMGYRGINAMKIKDSKERSRVKRMQALYRLPNDRTAEDMAKRIGAVFGGMV